jgi:Preprotein translocase subunit SecB
MPRLEAERSLAARAAACCDLEDIRLFSANAVLESPAFEGDLSYSVESKMSYQTLEDPVRNVVVTGEYEVAVFDSPSTEDEGGEGTSEPSTIAKIDFSLAALFAVSSVGEGQELLRDEEYEAFAATTGQFALYPYAREFVADVTSRMGLPTLHVRALRIELDSRTGE